MSYIYVDGLHAGAHTRSSSAGATCRKCGSTVAAPGKICAQCATRGSGLRTLLMSLIALQGFVVAGLYVWNGNLPHASKGMQHVVDDAAPTAEEVAARGKHFSWFYYETRDARLNDTMRHAKLDSAANASAHVDEGTLELRTSNIYGRSAVFTLDRGPADPSGDQAMVGVKFDDRPEEQFAAQETADDNSYTVSVTDYAKFASDMQGAHAMVVNAQLGAKTDRVMKFQVAGLTW